MVLGDEKRALLGDHEAAKRPIILDLCGGSGSRSKPYKEAGYDVRLITLPDYDVLAYTPPENVYGVLAAYISMRRDKSDGTYWGEALKDGKGD